MKRTNEITEPTKGKLLNGLVFGYFDVLMPGHLSFLGKAKAMCEHLTVALSTQPTGRLAQDTLERRKSELLNTGFVDKIVPVKDFDECATVIKNENIDLYAYGNPKWRIETPNCEVRHIDSDRVYLRHIVPITGHACTLKCKDCCALSPFAPRDVYYYNIGDIIDSLKKVAMVADIGMISIAGGEPFLHPDLSLLLTYAINSNTLQVMITTNGTVMPNVSLDLLTNPKVIIRISTYPAIAEKQCKLKGYLDQNGINVYMENNPQWYNLGCQPDRQTDRQTDRHNYTTKKTGKQAERNFLSCCIKDSCLPLENGVIGRCQLSVIAPRVLGFSPKEGDYLNVNESTDLKSDLYNYVYHPKYMEVCKYCNGTEGTAQVEPAQQLQH